MKNTITFIFFFCAFLGFSQSETEYTAKYRVTAVSKLNNDIISVSNTIEVNPNLYLYIPNAFTPNEDGLNDSFGALGYGVKDYHLIIYNRWGQLVFETQQDGVGWDGKVNGQTQGTYVFVWTVSAVDYLDQPYFSKGLVTLIR